MSVEPQIVMHPGSNGQLRMPHICPGEGCAIQRWLLAERTAQIVEKDDALRMSEERVSELRAKYEAALRLIVMLSGKIQEVTAPTTPLRAHDHPQYVRKQTAR